MATITSNGTGGGNWGTGSTWAGGVAPVDDDTVVIASGDTVIFNVDTSGFANGINGMTITGTLKVSTTTSSYMKMKASTVIGGAGTFNIGESGAGAIPFAVKFTLTGGAAWSILATSGLTMTVYGAEPSIKYVKLSGDEAIGQTELSVDTNVTGDIWAVGNSIYICDINGAREVELRTIAAGGIAAGAITVTAGLTAAKSTGAYVILATRNVRIVQGSDNELLRGFSAAKFAMGSGEIMGNSTNQNARAYTGNTITLAGGIFHQFGYIHPNAAFGQLLSAGIFVNIAYIGSGIGYSISGGLFAGCGTVLSGSLGYISGGIFVGNTNVINVSGAVNLTGGTFIGNENIIYNSTDIRVDGTNAVFTNNKYFMNRLGNGYSLYNVDFNVITSEYYDRGISGYAESIDHDQVDGALKAWSTGGIVSSQVTTKPDGYTQAYQHVLANATYECYWKKTFSVEPSKTVNVVVQLRKDASMSYLPRVYLMASIGNPLAGATPVDTFTMTDSTNTWESDTFTIANSTNYDQDYTLYFVAMNASGNAYSAYDITTEGGSGGAVRISPAIGRLG